MISKRFKLFAFAFVLVLAMVACGSTSSTPASCGFVVGDGREGNDAKVHKIVYPGQVLTYDYDDEIVTYVPCNSRNYIINDGSVVSVTGVKVGDRNTPVLAYTDSGVPILVSVSTYWTLNQSRDAMENFYEVCLKYSCASRTDLSGVDEGDQPVNNSSGGWIDMLDENVSPAIVRAVQYAASQIEDSVWRNHSQEAYAEMAAIMSSEFDDIMRATLGYPQDLFCGSGNSAWADPKNPGTGEFVCSTVRFVIDQVDRAPVEADNSSEGAKVLNAERLEAAQALYGEYAEFWLGVLDSIEKCNEGDAVCIINIGGGTVPVAVPPTMTPPPVQQEGGN